jgi:hypothetical protein
MIKKNLFFRYIKLFYTFAQDLVQEFNQDISFLLKTFSRFSPESKHVLIIF